MEFSSCGCGFLLSTYSWFGVRGGICSVTCVGGLPCSSICMLFWWVVGLVGRGPSMNGRCVFCPCGEGDFGGDGKSLRGKFWDGKSMARCHRRGTETLSHAYER